MNFSRFLALILALVLSAVTAHSIAATVVQSTAFTYQGQLNAGGILPAGQIYQFTFTLYDASSGGNVVGSAIKQAILVGNGGLFTTDLDFGQIFNGTQYWLDIQVGTLTTNEQELAARQPINAVPVAQYALNTPTGTFAEFYLTNNVQLLGFDPVPFPSGGPSSGKPIGSSLTYFVLPTSGTYEVTFEVWTSTSNQALVLRVNGVALAYTSVGNGSGSRIIGKSLITALAGDVLSVVNDTPTPLIISSSSPAPNSPTANLVIKLLH